MSSLDDSAAFFVDLAGVMKSLGFSTDAIEDAVLRVAHGNQMDVDVLALQSTVLVEVGQGGNEAHRTFRFGHLTSGTSWRLARTKAIQRLIEQLSGGTTSVQDGQTELARISSMASPLPELIYLVAYVVYSSTIAVRVGGAWVEMAVAAAVSLAMAALTSVRRLSGDLTNAFVASFCAGGLVTVLSWIMPVFDVRTSLFGGIALLVPAMAMTTAAHELAHDRLEAGAMRLFYAIIRFAMLAAGIAAALRLMGGLGPGHTGAASLPRPAVLCIVVIGGCALAIHLRAELRDLPWIVGAVVLALGAQTLADVILRGHGTAFVAALSVGTVGYLQARIPGHAASTVILPGLLQLVPGLMGTTASLSALAGTRSGEESLVQALLVAFQLILGVAFASALFQRSRPATGL